MLKSFVLERNKELIVRNIINDYVWYNKDIKSNFIESIQYENNLLGLENDINKSQIEEYLKQYINSLKDINRFNKFIKTLKEYHCNKLNNKEFLVAEGLEEYFNNLNVLYDFIIDNVIISINN